MRRNAESDLGSWKVEISSATEGQQINWRKTT